MRRVPSARRWAIPLSLRAPYGPLLPGFCRPSGFRSRQQWSLGNWTRARAGSMAASQGRTDVRPFLGAHWIYWIYASNFAYVFEKYAHPGNPTNFISFGSPRICGPGHRLRDIAGPRRHRWGLVLGTKPSPVSRAPSGRSPCCYPFGHASRASTA